MKRKVTGFLFIGLTAFAIGACKKDSKETTGGGSAVTPPITTTPKFEGKVNGTLKTASTTTATFTTGDSGVNVEGQGNSFRWGMLADYNAVAGQTYDLATGGFLIGYSPNAQGDGGFISESGSVNVIKNDTVNNIMEVKFQGTFADFENEGSTISVTNGHMICTYTE